VNCEGFRKLLALDLSGDLRVGKKETLRRHLQECASCQNFATGLETNQRLLRTLRHEVVPASALAEMRQSLFAQLGGSRKSSWWLRLERFVFGELRRPRYAMLCLGLVAIVSLTVLAQLRHASANPDAAPFAAGNTFRLPEDFREWKRVGTSAQFSHAGANVPQNIYVNPMGYEEYRRSGRFPQGTVLILESPTAIAASIKDGRFAEGWGYFQFTDHKGKKTVEAAPLPESAGCLACHRDRGATDHVFTQFYPVLRSASGVL
jgi:hypothetical protein